MSDRLLAEASRHDEIPAQIPFLRGACAPTSEQTTDVSTLRDVVANAVYQRWTGRLTITSIEGHQITPGDWAVQLQLVQQDMASASVGDLEEAQARLDFVRRNIGELIYDIRCRRGHSTLRTGPQIARALRRTPGRWVSF
jgi:hypothetical protein